MKTSQWATILFCALVAFPAARAWAADTMPDAVRREGVPPDDWKKLAAGEIVARITPAQGQPPQSFAAGAVIIAVPWQHAFEQIGRVEQQAEYSSCLKAMEVLMRASRNGTEIIKTRETHKSLWMTAHYSLDYVEDPERREIRWQLDPGAKNDVARMSGAWRFIPLDDERTLVTYRVLGSSGRALPHEIEDYFAKMMLPGFLKSVRKHVEGAHAYGEH
jgi:hypothetical protein